VLGLPERATRAVRGRQIGILFQESGTGLKPIVLVVDPVVEAIETYTAPCGHTAGAKAVQRLQRVVVLNPNAA